jgi:hypothetical protein
MRLFPVRIMLSICCLALTCGMAWSQTTLAQISGTVKDQSGAVLPGVEVSVTQTDTGLKRSVPTDETGSYILANLPLGPYRLEAALPGFRTYVRTGIILQVGASPVVNAVLEVGQVSEQVEVKADAALVETRGSGVGTVVDNQRVLELPLNGRNVQELVVLAGMANVNYNSGSLNSIRNYPTVVISVAGGVSNGVTYMLDGAVNNDAENNLSLPMPFPDALQEFKVETSALPAQYGLHASAAVNAITKAGTNEFHGDAFEFVRNGIFNARDFFATTRDSLKRNQFGGTIGGPLKKDKLFVFGGYQRTTQRSAPAQNIAYVPTPAMLAGDFTAFASPACAGKQVNLPASFGFVNNQISPSRFDPAAINITKRLPVATADPCGRTTFGLLNNQNEDLWVSRLDYAKSAKQTLFGRLFVARLTSPTTFDGQDLLTVQTFATNDKVYTLAFGDTYLIGNSTVSAFRASISRTAITKLSDQGVGGWPAYGVNAASFLQPVIAMSMSAGSGFSIGGGNAIVSIANTGPNYNASEDISMVRGAHQVGFGATYMHIENAYHSGVNGNGTMTFNGQFTGLQLADFLLGQTSQWKQGNLSVYYNRQHYVGAYLQDAWKATPRLTLNYGVRWEPYFAFSSKYGWYSHFDQALYDQNVHSQVYVNAPAGLIFPGDPQYTCGQSLHCNRLGEFLPRVSFAWDPKGDGKTSVRAAFGTFTERAQTISLTGFGQDVPFGNAVTLQNVSLSNPWASYPGGNPFPTVLNKNVAFSTFGLVDTHPLHAKPTTVNQWNLSFQRQVGTDWLLTANYLGSSTFHLQTGTELNPAVFLGLGPCTLNGVNYSTCSTTGNTNQRRRLYLQDPVKGQYYGLISQMDDGGTGTYNALYLSAQKRLSHGTTVLANYTFSHCISDFWNAFVGGSGASNGYNPAGRRAERSNCVNTDVRQTFNTSVVAQTPKFANRTLGMIASNWQISPILKIRTGQFFTVTTAVDNALNGSGTQRPNQILADPYLPNKGVDGWLNPKAFASPAPGTYGNLAPNNLLGPGSVQLDLALSRTFAVAEKKTIQLRAEAFNLPNHLTPGTPVATTNTAGTFGKIQNDNVSGTSSVASGNYRVMQFALKFVF